MNNIVIVEDKLKRAISLANQFVELSEKHPEFSIVVSGICYFCANSEEAIKDIEEQTDYGFDIEHVTLLNFAKILDEYLYSDEGHTLLIIDYMLDGDGSFGVPTRRVNIRYAKNRQPSNQLWFYTGTGSTNENILKKLVGKDYVLDVVEVDKENLKLDLENENFIKALKDNLNVEV